MKRTHVIAILMLFYVLLAGCSTNGTIPESATDTLEIVGSVPADIELWLHNNLSTQKHPVILFETYGDFTYYVATMGERSVEGGTLKLSAADTDHEEWQITLNYTYPPENENQNSLDTHFLILKAPAGQPLAISMPGAAASVK